METTSQLDCLRGENCHQPCARRSPRVTVKWCYRLREPSSGQVNQSSTETESVLRGCGRDEAGLRGELPAPAPGWSISVQMGPDCKPQSYQSYQSYQSAQFEPSSRVRATCRQAVRQPRLWLFIGMQPALGTSAKNGYNLRPTN